MHHVENLQYLVVDDHVVLGRHVVSNVVVYDKTQQSVEQRQVNLLVHFLIARLKHYIAFSLSGLPNILQVVNA